MISAINMLLLGVLLCASKYSMTLEAKSRITGLILCDPMLDYSSKEQLFLKIKKQTKLHWNLR